MTLRKIIRGIQKELSAKDTFREKILDLSRASVRLSSQSILAIHRGSIAEAKKRLERAKSNLDKMKEILQNCPEMIHSGSVYTAYQEFVEANLLLNFVLKEDFPTPESLGVPSIPYLIGLTDFVGELRRKALDSIREDDLKVAERCLKVMEDVYESLLAIERGRALIPGFRGKVDSVRKRIEETRGDLTVASKRSGGGKAKAR